MLTELYCLGSHSVTWGDSGRRSGPPRYASNGSENLESVNFVKSTSLCANKHVRFNMLLVAGLQGTLMLSTYIFTLPF